MTDLPPAARAVASAATAAVGAATRRDADALESAAGPLAATDGTGLVLGSVARLLLEELHPDGLDADDVRTVLEDCVRSAGAWMPGVDPHVMLLLLTSALGVHDPDEAAPDPAATATHGPLLVAHLVTGAPRPLAAYLTTAFTEIRRRELHD